MAPTDVGRRDSFVVRIWHEAERPGWKGWAQHTAGGESISFQHWSELLAFLERWVEEAERPVQTGLR
jgi:hypothetical protein